MKKITITCLLFVVAISIFFVMNNAYKLGLSEIECMRDADCEFIYSNCRGASTELCAPRWGAFCVKSKCELSRNTDSTRSEQWLDTCNEYKNRGSSELTLQNCYKNAAQAAQNYSDSFKICEDYFPIGFLSMESCKTLVCNNIPSANQESAQCYKLSRQTTSCSDGLKNGGETDVDCGGDCNPCDNLKYCRNNNDCNSNNCVDIKCVNKCPTGKISNNLPCSCYTEGRGPIAFTGFASPQLYCCNGKTQSGMAC